MYVLKKGQPPFEVVDGPMTGQSFKPGREYSEVPKAEKGRFEKVKAAPAAKPPAKGKESTKNA